MNLSDAKILFTKPALAIEREKAIAAADRAIREACDNADSFAVYTCPTNKVVLALAEHYTALGFRVERTEGTNILKISGWDV